MRGTLQTQSVGSLEPSCMVVVNSFAARGSGERRHSSHLELPLSDLYVPGWQGSQRTPFMISMPASHSHLAEPSDIIVWMKPSSHTQSATDVDATGDIENSGHLLQAVPRSCPSSGLYVPSVQSTTRPAVHHLPFGCPHRDSVMPSQRRRTKEIRRAYGVERRAAMDRQPEFDSPSGCIRR